MEGRNVSLRTVIISALVLIAMVAPGSAYYFDFAASGKSLCDVHLHFDGYSDAAILAAHPGVAADALMSFARDYGRKVTRSESDVAWQIEEHADAWMAGYNRDQTNPMDIEVNDGPC
jgi:hypothetical protein